MAGLNSFFSPIRIVLGSAWAGLLELNPDDILYLHNAYPGDNSFYSENGSIHPNINANRLLMRFASAQFTSVTYARVYLNRPTLFSGAFYQQIGFAQIQKPEYDFLDVWAGTPTIYMFGGSDFTASNHPYNPKIFSSLSIGVDSDLNILSNGTILRDGNTLDLSGWFDRKFTIENVGASAINLTSAVFGGDDAEKFSIAVGSEWDGGNAVIPSLNTTSLWILCDHSELGTL